MHFILKTVPIKDVQKGFEMRPLVPRLEKNDGQDNRRRTR